MSVVTYVEAWPARGQPFTVDDLDRLPDDGRRYELLDGVLIVSPRPTTVHQLSSVRLATLLENACPADLCVLTEPALQLSGSGRSRCGSSRPGCSPACPAGPETERKIS